MEMVSSNRMRRVMSHIEYNHKYFVYIRTMMREILNLSQDEESGTTVSHPYLIEKPNARRTYIVFSGDKGLCGSYNSSVLELADECVKYPDASLITVGNTAEEHFHRAGRIPDIAMLGIVQDPTLKTARRLSREIMGLLDEELTDEVHVVYTSFYGATKNKPVVSRILPLVLNDYADVTDFERLGGEMMTLTTPQKMFDALVPQYVLGLIFGVMVQAYAGEHFARMNAMHSSTQNAQDMLKTLQTQYNLARQSAITNEIAEITGAAEILKGGQ
jgi:F-type H+-transporting ATPase subunit gamma